MFRRRTCTEKKRNSCLGKAPHASSVRSELRHKNEWTLADKTSLEYTFYLTSTDFSTARFTVGQFLQICDTKESPLCRIEVENDQITATVNNYKKDGTTKADGKTHKYSLGTIAQKQEVTIKIAIDNKIMHLYRNGIYFPQRWNLDTRITIRLASITRTRIYQRFSPRFL